VVVLIGLMIRYPAISERVSEAVQAESGVVTPSPEIAPTQLAQPNNEVRTVRAY
jgi:hypothetical protein